MGCVNSRDARKDRRKSPSPYDRSVSLPIVHGSRRTADSHHVVSLTSSTLGFLNLDGQDSSFEKRKKITHDRNHKSLKKTVTVAGTGAGERCEPESETINAWELMEGLDDDSSLPRPAIFDRSFSFDAGRCPPKPHPAKAKSSQTSAAGSPKPFWMTAGGESLPIDPDVISNFRKAMNELSPQHPSLLHRSPVTYRPDEIPRFPGIVKARVAAFQEKIDARKASVKILSLHKSPPDGTGKVVLYFTTLRGIRRTYEDCCNARAILQIYGIRIDERDVSMHGAFRDELNEILGYGYGGKKLPRIFVNCRHLGGIEEVVQMHDAGKLGEVLKECEAAETSADAREGSSVSCEGCGGFRFLPCETCFGSCKVFVEEEDDQIGGFRRCTNCNENGLVRCPLCC